MKLLMFTLFGLIFSAPMIAQPTADWEMVFYESGADGLTVVNAAGVTDEIALPEGLARPAVIAPMRGLVNDIVRLSHDEMQLAILDREAGQIGIANLASDTCCTVIELSDYLTTTQVPGLVDFRPDGSQLAVSFVDTDDQGPDESVIGLLIFGTEGELIQQIDATRLSDGYVCRIENHPNGWQEDGIYYAIPLCTHAGYMTHRWEPDSDVVDLRVGSTEVGFRDELPGADEAVHVAYNDNYPLVDSGPVVSNVIMHETAEDKRVIFATGTYTVLPRVYWASSGDRVALQLFEGGALLLDRQGRTQEIPGETLEDYFALTGSGWLTWSNARVLRHYAPDNLAGETLVEFDQSATVAYRSFPDYVPTVAERFPLVEPIVCEGSLPMILEAGRLGNVLPGVELDVYSEAQGEGEILGSIVDGHAFYVIGGPVCGDDTWWRIQYQATEDEQIIGWIPEGSGDAYLTER